MELSTIEEINETSYMQCYLGMKQKKFLSDARELMNFTIEDTNKDDCVDYVKNFKKSLLHNIFFSFF
ncbi:hypothetical protein LOK49_LG12G02318 [Camellia lanceoleosa]|uniref:Uncharacterized protein n=1 Tax=Camellia lanceoleosa TaxID=1840588 RepID=A0ACC0FTJ4_9ERIC|nr:hypothetical protein LOK49_LG12G02318 [Camellia lanceoleosa]